MCRVPCKQSNNIKHKGRRTRAGYIFFTSTHVASAKLLLPSRADGWSARYPTKHSPKGGVSPSPCSTSDEAYVALCRHSPVHLWTFAWRVADLRRARGRTGAGIGEEAEEPGVAGSQKLRVGV
ncbi:unnamed protein product [Symbiodinium natans]|uniref:Uncharacterized protein n=1 Tax=Symbiodinium natans TaxID=878477 RepID=A0A812S7S2_9DINO|nr:unnamed protein product [Symbiodinium natans]